MNPTLDVIARRKSLRAYADQPLTPAEKEAILGATLRAPTAGNMMLYSIVEIEEQALKDRLAETCDHQPFIAKAPYVLLFLADYQRWVDYYAHCEAGRRCLELGQTPRDPQVGDLLLACCDALIAAQTAVIAAEALGIGSCYIGDILENYEIHRELLALPRYVAPITLVCFGHPAAKGSDRLTPRFGPEFIVHKNAYRRLSGEELERMVRPAVERSFAQGEFPLGAENFGQYNYLRKFIADFSVEMSRSVGAMLKNWSQAGEEAG